MTDPDLYSVHLLADVTAGRADQPAEYTQGPPAQGVRSCGRESRGRSATAWQDNSRPSQRSSAGRATDASTRSCA